jgi:predicted DNA-binding transcriptional regulator YafY
VSKLFKDWDKVQRQNQIKRLLAHTSEASAMSITEITERLNAQGCSINRKTVERDIRDISSAYPLSETGTNPSRFFFDGEFKIDFELVFDETQLQTIILALQSLKQMSPSVLKALCLDVENTLVSKLPRALGKEFDHLKSISHAAPTVLGEGGEIETEVLHSVLQSLRKGKIFECHYRSTEQTSDRRRKFAPLKLHLAEAPYLYVYDCEDNLIKLLRISRISRIQLTSEVVDKKRAQEIKLDYVFGGYGKGTEKVIHYAITCTKGMADRFTEHKIHPTQKIEVLKQGKFKITFSVHDSLEVIRLLSQYGEFIEKIEPAGAYAKVKEIWKRGLRTA